MTVNFLDGNVPTTKAPTPAPQPSIAPIIVIEEEPLLVENQTLQIAMIVAVTAFISVACTLVGDVKLYQMYHQGYLFSSL